MAERGRWCGRRSPRRGSPADGALGGGQRLGDAWRASVLGPLAAPATASPGRGRGRGRSGTRARRRRGEAVAEVRGASASAGRDRRAAAGRRRPGPRRPRHASYLMAFLRPEPAVKRGTLVAAICIDSPVRGLRPSRAPRSATWNLPKPVNVTSPPPLSSSSIVFSTASTAATGVLLRQARCCQRPCRRTPASTLDPPSSHWRVVVARRGVEHSSDANTGADGFAEPNG